MKDVSVEWILIHYAILKHQIISFREKQKNFKSAGIFSHRERGEKCKMYKLSLP